MEAKATPGVLYQAMPVQQFSSSFLSDLFLLDESLTCSSLLQPPWVDSLSSTSECSSSQSPSADVDLTSSRFRRIYDIGLEAATKQLQDWKDEGELCFFVASI